MLTRAVGSAFTLLLSIALSAQGHWLSVWGGISADRYSSGKSTFTYRSQFSPNIGLRYGKDLGPAYRFCFDVRFSDRRYTEEFGDPETFFHEERTYKVREMTVAIMGAVRIISCGRCEARIIFGTDLIFPRSAVVDLRAASRGSEGRYELNAPQGLGIWAGARHAHRCTDLLSFFTELRLSSSFGIGTAQTRLPGGGSLEMNTSPRLAVLLCAGLEIGRSGNGVKRPE